jgi:hypothetical protein
MAAKIDIRLELRFSQPLGVCWRHTQPRSSLKRFYVKRSLVGLWPFCGTSAKGCLGGQNRHLLYLAE